MANPETPDPPCECPKCGRMHRPLGMPPWALDHEDLCRLSRAFNVTSDLRTARDQHINDWLKKMIAEAAL